MNIPVIHHTRPNPCAARENRQAFDASGIICVNLVGAAGCGKTAFLEAILPRIQHEAKVAVLEGDLAATCDARRLGSLGVPVVQILTDGHCHLSADQVQRGLAELPLAEIDLLIVENVGSPICPAWVDLGEHLRIAALSISAGHLLAEKYPLLFRDAGMILLTKHDLLAYVDFDLDQTVRRLKRINPAAEVICTATKNRLGFDRAAGWLLGYVRAQRMRRTGRLPRRTVEMAGST